MSGIDIGFAQELLLFKIRFMDQILHDRIRFAHRHHGTSFSGALTILFSNSGSSPNPKT